MSRASRKGGRGLGDISVRRGGLLEKGVWLELTKWGLKMGSVKIKRGSNLGGKYGDNQLSRFGHHVLAGSVSEFPKYPYLRTSLFFRSSLTSSHLTRFVLEIWSVS